MRMNVSARYRTPRLLAAIAALGLLAFGPARAGEAAGYAISLWAPPTPPGTTMAAIYGEIDGGGATDRLLAVQTSAATTAGMHRSEMDGGVMRMRPVDAYDIAADTPLRLEPGASHVMLMGLGAPLVAGEHFSVTLTFEQAGAIEAEVTVREP